MTSIMRQVSERSQSPSPGPGCDQPLGMPAASPRAALSALLRPRLRSSGHVSRIGGVGA
jgi:hypothetical protein